MKRLLLGIALVFAVGSYVYAQSEVVYPPDLESSNMIRFTQGHSGTSTPFEIYSIVYASASGSEVGGTGGFVLQDESQVDIAACEATALTDQCIFTFPYGLRVKGFFAQKVEGGSVTVYGKQK